MLRHLLVPTTPTSFLLGHQHRHHPLKCLPLPPTSGLSARRPRRQNLIFIRSATPGGSGEEPPETLFMKELKRRGLSKRSEENENKASSGAETKVNTEERNPGPQMMSDQRKQSMSDQRKQSMALTSEGLEGLIPRAQALLSLGGGFFLVFWPLIIASIAAFVALYFYYGPVFIHSGERGMYSKQTYGDPYELLENEQIPSKDGPSFVPFSRQ